MEEEVAYGLVRDDERLLEVVAIESDHNDGEDELEDAQDEVGKVNLAR